MKILILGANGMAGHMIGLYLQEQGYEVTGFSKEKNFFYNHIRGNALERETVKAIIFSHAYDIVINCIGMLNKAVDDNIADGIYLNSVLPHDLENYLKETAVRLIHISTDCVFSGKQGSYAEKSVPDAESYYGRSKVLGEVCNNKDLTFRTSIVGPELKSNGIGLFHWFMSQKEMISGYTHVIWSGITTLELAKAIDAAIRQELTGLYHLVNNQKISKYDLLCLFNEYFDRKSISIKEDDTFSIDRSLINKREDFQYAVSSYTQMIMELSEWMSVHKELYMQYYKEN